RRLRQVDHHRRHDEPAVEAGQPRRDRQGRRRRPPRPDLPVHDAARAEEARGRGVRRRADVAARDRAGPPARRARGRPGPRRPPRSGRRRPQRSEGRGRGDRTQPAPGNRSAGVVVDEGVATTLPSRRKAAILCVSLGPEGAAEVFKHLPDDVMEKLTVEMARTQDIKPDHAEQVMREVVENAYAHGYIAEGGVKYAREVLTRAVGPDKADEILQRLATFIEATPFEFLRATPADQIYAFLRAEHPQTVALVLANMPTME